jgi:HSP20 family molecular chaperone IbpA
MSELFLPRNEDKIAILPAGSESMKNRMTEMFDKIAKRAYELFDGNGRELGHDLEHWFKAEVELLHPVHVRVTESGNNLEVEAEVPGFHEKDLQVSVEPMQVTISGKRESSKEEKKGKTVYTESCSGQILRIVDLPVMVDAERVTATLKNGMLQLTLPKAVRAKTVEIRPAA